MPKKKIVKKTAKKKSIKVGSIGNLIAQTIEHTFSPVIHKVDIVKDGMSVNISELLDTISDKVGSLGPEESRKILSMIYLFNPNQIIDPMSIDDNHMVSSFFMGYYLAKFISKTGSKIQVNEINVK